MMSPVIAELIAVERAVLARGPRTRAGGMQGLGTVPRTAIGYCAPWNDWRAVNPFLTPITGGDGSANRDTYRLRSIGSGGFTFDPVTRPTNASMMLGWPAGAEVEIAKPSSAYPCEAPTVDPVENYGRRALITNGGYSAGAALLGGLLVGFGAKKAGASPKAAIGAGVVGAGVAGATMFYYTSGWL